MNEIYLTCFIFDRDCYFNTNFKDVFKEEEVIGVGGGYKGLKRLFENIYACNLQRKVVSFIYNL